MLYLFLPLVGLATELGSDRASGFRAPGLGSALGVSFLTATCTTAICAVFGVPLAYRLAHARGPLAGVVGGVVLLPLALPPLMAGILLVSVIGPNTGLGQLFGGRLTDTMAGIVLAQTFVAAPFTIVAARSAFATVEPALMDVAATSGMGSWLRFSRVALPAAARGVGAGLLLTWLRAFGEFGATVIVAYHPYSLPVFTYVRFGGFGLAQAMAPTVTALAVGGAVLAVTRVRPPPRKRAEGVAPATAPIAGHRAEPVSFRLDQRLGTFHLHLAHAATSPRLALLGPSGAGKTSTLRCIAGLAGPRTGEVRLGSRSLGAVPCEHRRLGYVPQEPSLVPNRSLWHQVTFGPDAQPGLASYWIERLGLRGLEDRTPGELSGGQRHRVALARALARAPQLLLLDEPFAQLDVPVRSQLRRELRRVLHEGACASVLVTHDPEEAALLADEILVIDDGHLLQAGASAEVFAHPATPSVARLLGIANIHRGRVCAPGVIDTGGVLLRAPDATPLAVGTAVRWCIRSEQLRVSFARGGCGPGHEAVVVDAADLGTSVEVRVVAGDVELLARVPSGVPAPGTPCTVEIDPEHIKAWPVDGSDDHDVCGATSSTSRARSWRAATTMWSRAASTSS